jgi:hypothetical protein
MDKQNYNGRFCDIGIRRFVIHVHSTFGFFLLCFLPFSQETVDKESAYQKGNKEKDDASGFASSAPFDGALGRRTSSCRLMVVPFLVAAKAKARVESKAALRKIMMTNKSAVRSKMKNDKLVQKIVMAM